MATAAVSAVAWLLNAYKNACYSENINKHTLAHQVTKERAKTVTIGHVVELAVRRYSNEEGQHLQALYNKVKGEFSTQKMVLLLSYICTHPHLHRWLQPVCEA